MSKKKSRLTMALLATVAMPMPTFAQESGGVLEEIIVTARKRDESLLEIPVSVSAFTADAMRQAGIENAQDLSDFAAGIDFRQFDFGGRNTPNIRVRGMIQQVITPSTQIGAQFWDGSYIGGGGGFVPVGGLERVEVIKGPQTAYFGRNTFAGAINFIPKQPGDEWEGNISLSWSPTDHDEFNVNGSVSGPINDKVGAAVWAGFNRDGGDFSFGDGEPFAQFTDKSFNGTLRVEPTDELVLKVTGYYTSAEDTTTGAAVNFTTPAGACNIQYSGVRVDTLTGVETPYTKDLRTLTFGSFCGRFPNAEKLITPSTRFPTAANLANATFGVPALSAINPRSREYNSIRAPQGGLGGWHRTYRFQLHGDYDIGDHTASVIVSRAGTGTTTRVDQNFGLPSPILLVGLETAIRELYYEARITSPQDQRLRYLAGVSDYNQHYNTFTDPARVPQQVDRQRSATISVFGSVDYDIVDDVTLSVEGRYTDEKFTAIEEGAVQNLLTTPPAQRTPCGATVCNSSTKYDAFLPRVILNWKPLEGATTYASWSQSKLIGLATQARSIAVNAPTLLSLAEAERIGDFLAPQKATQYEVGWKQGWDAYSMTLAVFRTTWKNQPTPIVIFLPGGAGTSSLRLPGDSKYTGFDLEMNGQFTEWFGLTGQVAYSNGVMKKYFNRGSEESTVLLPPGLPGSTAVSSAGNPVRNHPEWTGSLSPVLSGEFAERNWFLRGDFIYTGKFYTDYSRFNINGARKQTNVRAGIDIVDGTTIEVFGTNIFNSKVLTTTAGTTFGVGLNRKIFTGVYQAREWGVRLSAKF
ncbi:MAG: TonB-dependent receptor [Rhodospirillaceae bacterium]|nr:TonB-dependent receptor [Rhodospirillaceae bacterium]